MVLAGGVGMVLLALVVLGWACRSLCGWPGALVVFAGWGGEVLPVFGGSWSFLCGRVGSDWGPAAVFCFVLLALPGCVWCGISVRR